MVARLALYYPSWGIGSPRFMVDALLYWDRLACIVPFDGFRPNASWPDGLQRESDQLHEQFVSGIAPSDELKDQLHDRLQSLLVTEAPPWCRAKHLVPSDAAVLAVRKVSSRTLDLLSDGGWLAPRDEDTAVISRAAAGLLLGTLADEMASNTMPPVTDDARTFRAACNALLRDVQARQGVGGSSLANFHAVGPVAEDEAPELAVVLARVSRLSVNGPITPRALRRIRELREDSGFNEQRERFCSAVDRYVSELQNRPPLEHGPLHAHWEAELAKDRQALKAELRSAGLHAVFEKEGLMATGFSIGAGAGAAAAIGPAGVIVGIGLEGYAISTHVRAKRREIRDRHWSSWLVAAST